MLEAADADLARAYPGPAAPARAHGLRPGGPVRARDRRGLRRGGAVAPRRGRRRPWAPTHPSSSGFGHGWPVSRWTTSGSTSRTATGSARTRRRTRRSSRRPSLPPASRHPASGSRAWRRRPAGGACDPRACSWPRGARRAHPSQGDLRRAGAGDGRGLRPPREELRLPGLQFEIQIETPQAVLAADGTAVVARMVHAADGRVTGLHYGTYDYCAALGIAPPSRASTTPSPTTRRPSSRSPRPAPASSSRTAPPTSCPSATTETAAAWQLHAGLVAGRWNGASTRAGTSTRLSCRPGTSRRSRSSATASRRRSTGCCATWTGRSPATSTSRRPPRALADSRAAGGGVRRRRRARGPGPPWTARRPHPPEPAMNLDEINRVHDSRCAEPRWPAPTCRDGRMRSATAVRSRTRRRCSTAPTGSPASHRRRLRPRAGRPSRGSVTAHERDSPEAAPSGQDRRA